MEELNKLLASKILVIGCPGSGKTQFSQKLSDILGIDYYGLDDLYWQKNWTRPAEHTWLKTLDGLLKKKQWIIDGNYYRCLAKRLDQADFVIYLQYPMITALYRALKRAFARRYISKASLPAHIRTDPAYHPKFKVNLHFIYLIVFFKMTYHKKIVQALDHISINYVLLTSPKQAHHFLKHIEQHDD